MTVHHPVLTTLVRLLALAAMIAVALVVLTVDQAGVVTNDPTSEHSVK